MWLCGRVWTAVGTFGEVNEEELRDLRERPWVTLRSGGAVTVFQEEELVRGGEDGYTFGKH